MRIAWLAVGLAAGCFSKPEPPMDGPADRYGTISVGGRHACAIDADGELYCWGDNEHGQIGLVDPQPVLTPTRTGGDAGGWTAISAGGLHTCGLRDGGALCWGFNEQGQVAGGRGGVQRTPIAPSFATPPGQLTSITAGGSHSCAIGSGKLWCWGDRDQIGLAADSSVAVQIGDRSDWTTVVAGSTHVCGIAGTEVLCFGENDSGQAGSPGLQHVMTPTVVALPGGLRPLRLTTGYDVSCAIMGAERATVGELWCWGENGNGLIDASMGDDVATPTRVGTDARWSQIALAYQRACGIREGMAWCWGSGRDGAMGNGYWVPSTMTVADAEPIGAADAIALDLGDPQFNRNDDGGCLSRDGGIYCWGSNAHGRLGVGHRSLQPLPVEIPAPMAGSWRHVFVGRQHTCGQLADGQLFCWGANAMGQITAGIARGDRQPCLAGEICDVPLPRSAPAPISNPSDVVAAWDFTCTREQTSVTCWGQHTRRETASMNDGPGVNTLTGAYDKLLGGPRAACAVKSTTPGLTCWGPLPAPRNEISPTLITSTPFTSISIADDFACGVTGGNERVCWGNNQDGQLGNQMTGGNAEGEHTISGVTVSRVAANFNQGCEIRQPGGAVSCWGVNNAGEVGVSTQGNALAPVPVTTDGMGALAGCTELALSGYVSCALCSGRPYCWGYSISGQLARAESSTSEGYQAVEAEVPRHAPVVELGAGEGHSCALNAMNQLYCWGGGPHGQLGDGGHDVNIPTALGARQ